MVLGSFRNESADEVRDDQISGRVCRTELAIEMCLVLSSCWDLYDQDTCSINAPKLARTLRGHQVDHAQVLGWIKLRANSPVLPSVREMAVHRELETYLKGAMNSPPPLTGVQSSTRKRRRSQDKSQDKSQGRGLEESEHTSLNSKKQPGSGISPPSPAAAPSSSLSLTSLDSHFVMNSRSDQAPLLFGIVTSKLSSDLIYSYDYQFFVAHQDIMAPVSLRINNIGLGALEEYKSFKASSSFSSPLVQLTRPSTAGSAPPLSPSVQVCKNPLANIYERFRQDHDKDLGKPPESVLNDEQLVGYTLSEMKDLIRQVSKRGEELCKARQEERRLKLAKPHTATSS